MLIENKVFARQNLSDKSLGKNEFRECSFTHVAAQRLHFEDAVLLNCDMRSMRFLESTFRLSCKQGANNKLDEINASLFLMWFLHMFDLPPEMAFRVRSAIVDYERIKTLFDCESMIRIP